MPIHLYSSHYLVPIEGAPLEQGAIAVKHDRILARGEKTHLVQRYPHAPCTDFGASILLPALINAHTHLELSHFPRWQEQTGAVTAPRELKGEQGFTAWIIRLIEIKKALGHNPEIYRRAWLTGLHLTQCAGTGYIGDILTTPQLCATAAEHLPGRGYVEIIGHDPTQVHTRLSHLEHWAEHAPHALWGAAPHAPYTMSQEMLKLSFRTTATHCLPSSIHLAESDEEVEFLSTASGPMAQEFYPYVNWKHHLKPPRRMRPLASLQQAGGLRRDTLLVHGVHLNKSEIKAVAASGASVVLCPRSNAHLHCGKAPAGEYVRAGVPLALGTDSLASNNSLSIWDEMAFALQWFKGELSPQQLLHMATRGGARALGLNDVGTLAQGQRATFVVVTPPALPPLAEVAEFLCHSSRSGEVTALYRDGTKVDLSTCNEDKSI